MAILSIVLISAMFSVIPDVEAFGSDHRTITDEALKNLGFSDKAKERVIDANEAQDGIWCYGPLCPGTSNTEKPEYHGDRLAGETSRQAFDRLRNYINEQKELAKKLIKECKTKEAQEALGRALHALQDFYSHSNYVDELNADQQKQAKDALNDPTKDPPANLKMTGWGMKAEDDPEGYHHDKKNKDSAKSPLGKDAYETAKSAATQHTTEFVEGIKEQLGEESEAWKKLKGDPPPKPPPSTIKRLLPYIIPVYGIYKLFFNYTTSWATDLKMMEGLPNGVIFVSSVPEPLAVYTTTIGSPDNPPITLILWEFTSTEPIGSIAINYTVKITEEAATNPSVAWRCRDSISGYILFHGEVVETDVNGTEYRSNIGGQQSAKISGDVGGIVIPIDKLGLLAPYIALAVAVVAITVGTVYARKRWLGKAVVQSP